MLVAVETFEKIKLISRDGVCDVAKDIDVGHRLNCQAYKIGHSPGSVN